MRCFVCVIDRPIFIKELSPITAKDGETVSFSCQLVNAETVKWFYEEIEISVAEGAEIIFKDGSAELHLDNICVADEGEYTVKAINNVGEVSATARLTIVGKEIKSYLTINNEVMILQHVSL